MNQKYLIPLTTVFLLFLVAYTGVEGAGLHRFFGIVIPYLAVLAFLAGFVYKVLGWASSAVPFRIPTTCGQQKSLPWIKQNCIDNPDTSTGVCLRMVLEIFLFRSLFRNTKAAFNRNDSNKLSYFPSDRRPCLSLFLPGCHFKAFQIFYLTGALLYQIS